METLRGKPVNQEFHVTLLLFKRGHERCTISDLQKLRVRNPQTFTERSVEASLGERNESRRKEKAAGNNYELRNWYNSVRPKSPSPGGGSYLERRDWWR